VNLYVKHFQEKLPDMNLGDFAPPELLQDI
jgi:hypothetical protein